ncbi:MAG TPA: TolC family protein [Vicinamibacterales bacterium]|nr:TolC family protein [Vicinamibacterales bacterium]
MNGRLLLAVGFTLAPVVVAAARAQTPQPLTLAQAEQTALNNHPQIQAARYTSFAAKEIVREARSAYFPAISASLTGAGAENGSRIAAGGLNNPIIYNRFASGISVGQMLTDFGRTHALVASSTLNAQAQDQNVSGQRAAVLLEVDRAYFSALRAQAVQRVAQATVDARQIVVDQISALAASHLKSGLDVSFAKVNLATAQLVLAQAQNDTQRAFATLAATLGTQAGASYVLSEEPLPAPPPAETTSLVAAALRDRPEVVGARFGAESAARLAEAEANLVRPSVSVVGAFGMAPYRELAIPEHYSAFGINISVPVMNGNLFAARHAEATLRAEATTQRLRDVENQIARDVRIAWLNANTAFQRLGLTDQLLDQASQALDLAQSRYDLGLSSIVELSQAQLNKTQAELEQASAKYDYQVQTAALSFAIGARK